MVSKKDSFKEKFDYEEAQKQAEGIAWDEPGEEKQENHFWGFIDKAATRQAEAKIPEFFNDEDYDFEKTYKQGKIYLETFDKRSYVGEFLGQLFGLTANQEGNYDTEEIIDKVKSAYERERADGKKYSFGSKERAQFKRYLDQKVIPDKREVVYEICFKLGLDEIQTAEFFFKAAVMKPYMVKNINEAVYLFCLKNGKSYEYAKALTAELEAAPGIENIYPESNTVRIQNVIAGFSEEEQLREYILSNKAGFVNLSKAAIEQINKISERAAKYVKEDLTRIYDYGMSIKAEDTLYKGRVERKLERIENSYTSRQAMLHVILGYRERSKDASEYGSINDSEFPKLIKSKFPQVKSISDFLEDGKNNDVGRKTLILFEFYRYFSQKKDKAGNNLGYSKPGQHYEEFLDNMDVLLNETGYVSMYLKHPFDWMIAYCAWSESPLSTLQDFVTDFYTAPAEDDRNQIEENENQDE